MKIVLIENINNIFESPKQSTDKWNLNIKIYFLKCWISCIKEK